MYILKDHGDWLEQHAADFISTNIPAYETIWQIYIGHRGDGNIAIMNNIKRNDEEIRIEFSQHHYTILESLYFMQLIVDELSVLKQIISFKD